MHLQAGVQYTGVTYGGGDGGEEGREGGQTRVGFEIENVKQIKQQTEKQCVQYVVSDKGLFIFLKHGSRHGAFGCCCFHT